MCSPCASVWYLFELSCFSHAWSCSCQIVGLYMDARWLRPSSSLLQFYFFDLAPVTVFSWLVFHRGSGPWYLTEPSSVPVCLWLSVSLLPFIVLSYESFFKNWYGWSELQGFLYYFNSYWRIGCKWFQFGVVFQLGHFVWNKKVFWYTWFIFKYNHTKGTYYWVCEE